MDRMHAPPSRPFPAGGAPIPLRTNPRPAPPSAFAARSMAAAAVGVLVLLVVLASAPMAAAEPGMAPHPSVGPWRPSGGPPPPADVFAGLMRVGLLAAGGAVTMIVVLMVADRVRERRTPVTPRRRAADVRPALPVTEASDVEDLVAGTDRATRPGTSPGQATAQPGPTPRWVSRLHGREGAPED